MKKNRKILSAGLPSILTILLVLALTALCALSYSSGVSDLKLTERTVQMTRDYYSAVAQSEEISASANQSGDPETYLLSRGAEEWDGDYELALDAGSGRTLQVIYRIQEDKTVVCYRGLGGSAEEEWEEEYLPVYQGETAWK